LLKKLLSKIITDLGNFIINKSNLIVMEKDRRDVDDTQPVVGGPQIRWSGTPWWRVGNFSKSVEDFVVAIGNFTNN
jgi:hypothetical protein